MITSDQNTIARLQQEITRRQRQINALRVRKAVHKKIRDMEVGEYGWTTPSSFVRDREGRGYLWPIRSVQPSPNVTCEMFVARTNRGYVVNLSKCHPKEMELGTLGCGTVVHTIAVMSIDDTAGPDMPALTGRAFAGEGDGE